jgi:ketosteroid isomerase-like protein
VSHPFRAAVESGDHAAIEALLADDVVFTSPVAFKPYAGKPITAAILRGVIRVFADFRYLREVVDGPHAVLEFEARVGDVTVNGADFLTTDPDGLITDLKVMVRPLSAAQALAAAMGAQFEQIAAEAAAVS